MPSINLTDRKVKALKPPKEGQVDYWDEKETGFGLRVSAGGSKAWWIVYRNAQGRRKRFTLGTYPKTTVADARQRARDELGRVEKGADPAEEKKANRKAGTFSELADLYIKRYAKPNKRSWKVDESIIARDLTPRWGSRPAKSITRRDVNELLDAIVDRGAPIQSNRVLEITRKLFSWAISEDRVDMDINPCHEVKKRTKERRRDRFLDAGEIQTFWNGMEAEDVSLNPSTCIALRLILVTAQRPGEVTGAVWDEFDDDWETSKEPFWTIPGERTKNGATNRVPLSKIAVGLLKEAKELAEALDQKRERRGKKARQARWVFPSPREINPKPMIVNSLSHAIVKNTAFGVEHFRPHDLRRTATTHMAGEHCGVSRFILERILNHTDQSVTATYDLYRYEEEKRLALEAWGKRLTEIIEGRSPEGAAGPLSKRW